MYKLFRSANALEAQSIIALLESEQIACEIMNNYLSGAIGDIPFTEAGPEIWVEKKIDLALGKELVAEYFKTLTSTSEEPEQTQTCRFCQEASPSHFSTCWSCEKSFD